MNPFGGITLRGELVELRPLLETDREALFAAAADPLIWQQHPEPNRYRREIFDPYFDTIRSFPGPFAVVDHATRAVIGTTSFYDYRPDESSVIIGYTFIGRAYWGNTYNREMKRLMIDHAFRQVKTIWFQIGADNHRSQAAVRKLGAVLDGETVRQAPDGRAIRAMRFRLDRESRA